MASPMDRQRAAQREIGYGAIALRRVGEFAVVEVEFRGAWIEVIREPLDSNFSHIVEPVGIQEVIQQYVPEAS
jgi:hypothetical protein